MILIVLYAGPCDGLERQVAEHLSAYIVPMLPSLSWATVEGYDDPHPARIGQYSPSRPRRYDGEGRLIYDWRGWS